MQLNKIELLHPEGFHGATYTLLYESGGGLATEDVRHEFGEDMEIRQGVTSISSGPFWPGCAKSTEDGFAGAIDIGGVEGGEATARIEVHGLENVGLRDEAMAASEGPAAVNERGEGSGRGVIEANGRDEGKRGGGWRWRGS